MFEKSKEYQQIKKRLELVNVMDEIAVFRSYCDSIFTYEYNENGTTHEFNIICDDVLLLNMVVSDLLYLKSITYLEHNVYLRDEKIRSKTYKK